MNDRQRKCRRTINAPDRRGSTRGPAIYDAAPLAALSLAVVLIFPACAPNKILMSTPRAGDAWRMYGGGPGRMNASSGAVVPPLSRAWEYDAGSGFGPASAAVAESTVFVGTLTGEVRALNLYTGRETGAYDFGAAMFGTPVVLGGRIVVGLSGEGENLVCYNLRTGSVEWEVETGDIESSLLYAGGRIVAAGLDGSVAAYDTAVGKELWRYELPEAPGRPGIRSAPASDGERIVFGTDGGDVLALELATGALSWKVAAVGAVFAAPSIVGGKAFVCSLDGKITAIDLVTGEILWTFTAGVPLYGGAAAGRGMIVAGTSGGEVISLRESDGSVLWRTRTAGGVGSAPLVCGSVTTSAPPSEPSTP